MASCRRRSGRFPGEGAPGATSDRMGSNATPASVIEQASTERQDGECFAAMMMRLEDDPGDELAAVLGVWGRAIEAKEPR